MFNNFAEKRLLRNSHQLHVISIEKSLEKKHNVFNNSIDRQWIRTEFKISFFFFYFWSERDFKWLSIYISAVLSDCNLNFEYKLSNVENKKAAVTFYRSVCLSAPLSFLFFFFLALFFSSSHLWWSHLNVFLPW